MRKRSFTIQLLLSQLLCVLLTPAIWAAGSEVEVRPAQKELIETDPKNTLTAVFKVTNTSSKKRAFAARVELPDQWILITDQFPFELQPGRSDIRLLGVFVPQSAAAGKYKLTYFVSDRESPAISDFDSVYVIVLPIVRLETSLLDAPQNVIAGESYRSSFSVFNASNIESRVRLFVKSSDDLPFKLGTAELILGPGESRAVSVEVETDAEARAIVNHHLELTAEIIGKEGVSAKARSLVEVLPQITGSEERYHKIPAYIALRGKQEDGSSGFQIEFAGEGYLDDERTKSIKFLLRGADLQGETGLGQRDEYFLDYRSRHVDLALGDRSYSLSRLTEYYQYGTGAEVALEYRDVCLGGYFQKTRWGDPKVQGIAAFIDLFSGEQYQMRFNYLKKKSSVKPAVSTA